MGGDKKERNDRVILLPAADHRFDDVKDPTKNVRKELEQFFVTMTELTDKEITIDGWEGPKSAEEIIEKAAHAYVRRAPE